MVSHNIRIAGARGHAHYSGDVASKDVLKSFRNLLQSGDRTSVKKLVEDLDILWVSKGGNVDLSKWSKDDLRFSVMYISSPKGREKRRYKVDLKHLAVAQNCIYGWHSICLLWFFTGRCIKLFNNQHVCI